MAGIHEIVELGNRDHNCSASPSSSSVYHSTRMEELLGRKYEYGTAFDFEIAASKDHWSELSQPSGVAEDSCGGEEGKARQTNSEIVQSLRRQFPQAGDFFRDYGDNFVLGEKIAEGAHAEIFEASPLGFSEKFVLKVFKEGSPMLDLQKQWPLGMLNGCGFGHFSQLGCSPVVSGSVVMNGRFAFMMFRYAGDLRKLIDERMDVQPTFCTFFS